MKRMLKWGIPVILLFVILFLIKFNTNVYVAFEGGERLANVEITLKVDGEIIYNNISLSPAWSGINVKLEKMSLRMGFHTIEAFSENENVVFKKNVFILFNYYIMVEYWEDRNNFTARTGFNPFHFE